MASALLASNNHNEPHWKEPMLYMRQNPNPNNRNPNPNFTAQAHAGYDHHQPMDSDEATASTADPGDSATFQNRHVDSRGYVTFNISSYSRSELRDLKRRLVFELDQIRSFAARIESYGSAGYSITTCSAAPSPTPFIGSDDLVVRSDFTNKSATIAGTMELKKLESNMMKKCDQILSRIMKHKGGIWFNTPVDVVGMNLHDYNHIIKSPMDLGTVKSKLSKGMYSSCIGFADDVRLTFKNALAYNPQGHDVHKLADQLLKLFEGSFGPAYMKFEKQKNAILKREQVRQRAPPISSSAQVTPPAPKTMISLPKEIPAQQDKAKVREMSMKEKERLGVALQNLPEDKMNEVLEIVRRRNVEMPMDGDEVEIDFELMDSETLWELDRFVLDWNKMVSRIRKRQQESPAFAFALTQPSDASNKNEMVVIETTLEAVPLKKSKKGDPLGVEEDVVVDIGDEMPAAHYPSVVIEKQESSSSSSGSDSSSSSDSDSGSSSGGDSDDDAQSPVNK